MSSLSTKDTLLQFIDDIEIISKELLENVIAPKNQKLSALEHMQLAELLVAKDQELKSTLKQAAEQEDVQKKMDSLQADVEKLDQDIRQLQKHLKEAEHILATAIYQAKQKLQSISRANEHPTTSEELIKYAHRISACNAVAAPHNWQQGDARRPYPTDIEMRLGFLGRLSDLPSGGAGMLQTQQQQQGAMVDMAARGSHDQATTQAGTFTWQQPSEFKPTISSTANHNPVPMDTKGHKENVEDVEVMSTDSSSSSSSDSQ